MRVGSPDFDNTNFTPASRVRSGLTRSYGRASLPVSDDLISLRRAIWLETDAAYKTALERLDRKRSTLTGRQRPSPLPDFSEAPVERTERPVEAIRIKRSDVEEWVRITSAPCREVPGLHTCLAQIGVTNRRVRHLDSDGRSATWGETFVSWSVEIATRSGEGWTQSDFLVGYAGDASELPKPESVAVDVRAMAEALITRSATALPGRYEGPVLFVGQASAELFAQAFAPLLGAGRKPLEEEEGRAYGPFGSQAGAESPLQDRLGREVLPSFLSAREDPGLAEFGGRRLLELEPVDEDGVRLRPVELVRKGRLVSLLGTRTPARGAELSTGSRHGGVAAPLRLVVTPHGGKSRRALKKELLKLVRTEGLDYGIVVRRLANPAYAPRASRRVFYRTPGQSPPEGREVAGFIDAVRLYPDGREEPIRNLETGRVQVSLFRDILAVSKTQTAWTAPMSLAAGGPFARTQIASVIAPDVLVEELSLRPPEGVPPAPTVSGPPGFSD
jgi:hypothetical protein